MKNPAQTKYKQNWFGDLGRLESDLQGIINARLRNLHLNSTGEGATQNEGQCAEQRGIGKTHQKTVAINQENLIWLILGCLIKKYKGK